MKTVLLVLLAMLAIKTTTTTSATGQEACSKNYTGCVDKCVARPTPALQDTCMQACQTQSTACFSQVYGGPGPNAVTVKQEEGQPNVGPNGENPDASAMATEERPKARKPARTAKQPRQRPDRRTQ